MPSRRGPPKGYRRGAADPASLTPKIAKIREQITALTVAYGERLVLAELHRAVFGDPRPCEGGWPTRIDGGSASAMVASGSGAGSSMHISEGSDHTRSPTKTKSEWSQDEQDG